MKLINHFSRWISKRHQRFYQGKHWYLILDVILITTVLTLFIGFLTFYFYHPQINEWVIKHQIGEEQGKGEISITSEKKIIVINNEGLGLNTLEIDNTSSVDVENIKIELSTEFKKININRLTINETDDEINKSNRLIEIPSLKAGESKKIKLKLFFKQSSSSNRSENLQAKVTFSYRGKNEEKTFQLAKLELASRLNVEAGIYYHSPLGDQLGVGPLPPLVGIPTRYWLLIKAEAPDSPLENFIFSIKLPTGVKYTEQKTLSAGEIKYSADSHTIVWKVSSLNNNQEIYRAGLEIELTPNINQKGKEADLVNDIRYQAQDNFTGTIIEGSLPKMTSGLEFDKINKGQGIISVID